MAFSPTPEQKDIIEAELVPQQVIACAGSGKTATAVRRLLHIRKRLGRARGYVALLSYSNVAVDTFRAEYERVSGGVTNLSDRVLIATVDSFITNSVLLPHAGRVMGSTRQPFLVQGHEPFLGGFKVFNGAHNVDIKSLRVRFAGNEFLFFDGSGYGALKPIASGDAEFAVKKLAKTGAFTYELARYWSIMTLACQERLVDILARRYPYILVDEAQDVGSMHGAFLEALQQAGSNITLVGDPNQSIFEFADADGSYLRDFVLPTGGLKQPLTQNRRSVEAIVTAADNLAKTASVPFRGAPERVHGAFYIKYDKGKLQDLLTAFSAILKGNGFGTREAVVLCRGNPLVQAMRGGTEEMGQGAAEHFANAAVTRDRRGDIANAFEFALDGVLRILEKPPSTLRRDVLSRTQDAFARKVREWVWKFLRDTENGIPSAKLNCRSTWLPTLKKRIPALLDGLEADCKLTRLATWTKNVTAAKLGVGPLWEEDLIGPSGLDLRICTVHQAKGESIGAVLYVTKTKDLKNLLQGPTNEEGRIGYVAVTRACDLLFVAVPAGIDGATTKDLEAKGFSPWAVPAPQ